MDAFKSTKNLSEKVQLGVTNYWLLTVPEIVQIFTFLFLIRRKFLKMTLKLLGPFQYIHVHVQVHVLRTMMI